MPSILILMSFIWLSIACSKKLRTPQHQITLHIIGFSFIQCDCVRDHLKIEWNPCESVLDSMQPIQNGMLYMKSN